MGDDVSHPRERLCSLALCCDIAMQFIMCHTTAMLLSVSESMFPVQHTLQLQVNLATIQVAGLVCGASLCIVDRRVFLLFSGLGRSRTSQISVRCEWSGLARHVRPCKNKKRWQTQDEIS